MILQIFSEQGRIAEFIIIETIPNGIDKKHLWNFIHRGVNVSSIRAKDFEGALEKFTYLEFYCADYKVVYA
jgi:hypothetical protein